VTLKLTASCQEESDAGGIPELEAGPAQTTPLLEPGTEAVIGLSGPDLGQGSFARDLTRNSESEQELGMSTVRLPVGVVCLPFQLEVGENSRSLHRSLCWQPKTPALASAGSGPHGRSTRHRSRWHCPGDPLEAVGCAHAITYI
jgi:hypothetical protein